MNFLDKLERKMGRHAISHITRFFVICSLIGDLMLLLIYRTQNLGMAEFINYLSFSPAHIFKGQVWRLVTWIFMPSGNLNSIWGIVFVFCLWMLGEGLENYIGSFRMNVYFIGSIIVNDIVGLIVYIVTYYNPVSGYALPISLSMSYTLFSLYLMLGLFMPNAEMRLYFVLPIKMKWLVIVYFITYIYQIYQSFSGGLVTGIVYGTPIILAILYLLLFVWMCKNRMSIKQKKRQRAYAKATAYEPPRPRPGSGIGRHHCVVCGRTDESNPELSFRFCSKCTGGKEYCNDHLFTHTHS